MPLFASIDIGSNTLRLLIGEVKNSRIADICYERKITRLGTGVNQTGRLQDKNIEVSLAVLREFSSIISRHGVEYVRAVATSALREASNSAIFIKKVFADTGISIDVISGKKEAELILKGILSSLSELRSFTLNVSKNQSLFIVDIGGGSTEWIFYKDKHQAAATRSQVDIGSIPVGVIKLAGGFIKTDPVSGADTKKLNNKIVSFLNDLKNRIGHRIDRRTKFIGTAGTFTTIASIDLGLEAYSREKIHLHRLPLKRLQDICKKLLSLSLKERKNVRGLEPERADLIIPGILFTIKMMDIFKFKELTVSDYGLLEGALLDILSEIHCGGKEIDGKDIPETSKP
ncbi:MAG: exopolyphosphatase [Nitrospirae bacterium CG_4_10_14_0_8_um_filter_41_23]|nr:MAG: exopolyphosphatase [Nitrospirae bacterium CG_4_10_14_0_8_um_filter_41_23]